MVQSLRCFDHSTKYQLRKPELTGIPALAAVQRPTSVGDVSRSLIVAKDGDNKETTLEPKQT